MWYNPIVKFILRVPILHRFLSVSMMIITVTGTKSGKRYSVPVSFVVDDDRLLVVSFKNRRWWRNVRGGKLVRIRYRGRVKTVTADVAEDDATVAEDLIHYLDPRPQYAKYFGIELDEDGKPITKDVAEAAKKRVMVHIQRPIEV